MNKLLYKKKKSKVHTRKPRIREKIKIAWRTQNRKPSRFTLYQYTYMYTDMHTKTQAPYSTLQDNMHKHGNSQEG